jgi:uncharacterized protein YfaS (alpha-2-macroglobulin family)
MFLLAALPLASLAQTTVEVFTPQGMVKKVRQVSARFSGQVAAFGDLRVADPFEVVCPEAGKGRWIDGSNWSYDFERDLPGAVSCTFTLKADIRDLAGQPIAGKRSFAFNTGGPSIMRATPYEGNDVEENQVFVLRLDAPVTPADVGRLAWCQVDGIAEKIPLRTLAAAEYAALPAFKKMGKHPFVAVQCARPLPAGADMTLVWGKLQKLAYRVRKPLTASFQCERLKKDGACIPFLPMTLTFSEPVALAAAKEIVIVGADGKRIPATPILSDSEPKSQFVDAVNFKGPFSPKAAYSIHLPAVVQDETGRALSNAARFPLKVLTDAQPPLIKFPARFGILEANGDRLLPVTVRNVESPLRGKFAEGQLLRTGEQDDLAIIQWLTRLSPYWNPGDQYNDSLERPLIGKVAGSTPIALPRPRGKQRFEVIGIPLPKAGFYVVEFTSPLLGDALLEKGGKAYVNSAALVTNMAAHFKHGATSSLVWVTSLDKGRPVPDAQVAVRDCAGKLLWEGKADANGIARVSKALPPNRCRSNDHYFISARSNGDMTFTLSGWNQGIQSWRFNLPGGLYSPGQRIASTVFARTLLRAGETVNMKHFMRRHTTRGIEYAPVRPDKVRIIHQGSDDKVEMPVTWSAHGTAESNWVIPKDAKLGSYSVMLGEQTAGSFRVEQFRIPTMRGVIQGPRDPAIGTGEFALDLQLQYLAGGAASGAPVKLRSSVGHRALSYEDYDGFVFDTRRVEVGVTQERNWQDMDEDDDEGGTEGEGPASNAPVRTQDLVLDRAGAARITLPLPSGDGTPRELTTEMSYQDASGETLTISRSFPLWGSGVVLGIKPDSWMATKDNARFQVLALGVDGRPLQGLQVRADFYKHQSYTHRRRLLGGFYAYESTSEIRKLGAACDGTTDARGLLHCAGKAPEDGNLIVQAHAVDSAGRAATARVDMWLAGDGDWWFRHSDNDRIDLLPGKKRYEPGEPMRFQVRSPFRSATALVTVEREGVMETYVRHLRGKEPSFTIPSKNHYAPNVFVSALVVRGRVAGVQPTALVDLGKPAYKLGIAHVRVGWAAHTLNVKVSSEREVYKVRDKAKVKVKVTRDGGQPAARAEVALAAVDAGLLELMPNTSWDLLDAMMQIRSLQVETATSQMQVIGKRHFGRKAFPHGGGGGKGSGRELFDTLLYWKGKVVLDANGEAVVEVPLNDSLAAFRIVAVASSGASRFGTGSTEIRTSQDLMLLPGLPSLVREGDTLRAGFTVRNAGSAPMRVALNARAGGRSLPQLEVDVPAGEAREAGWDYTVPVGVPTLQWEVTASAGDISDKVRVKQSVKETVPVRVYQATLLQVDRPMVMQVERPAGALPGRGGIAASFAARIGGELPGVRDYMQRYPYTCLEQRTSRAVALRDEAMWSSIAGSMHVYLDADGLAKYFPSMDYGSDVLTAYLLSVTNEAGYDMPDAVRERMEGGLEAFISGKVLRYGALQTTDLAIRKLAAIEALSRSGKAKPEMLESFTIAPQLWPTNAVIDWLQILQRIEAIPDHTEKLAQAQQVLRARLNIQGTTMGFSTERTDDWWWLMVNADVNATRMLLAVRDLPMWQADMGRMARGVMGRQHKGHWGTTVANAWGVLAMEKFSEKFESEEVGGTTEVRLGSAAKQAIWQAAEAPKRQLLPWPDARAELQLRHQGGGKPWVAVQSLAALPLTAPISSGYTIRKTITPLERKTAASWSRGDTYRVRLELEAQADMTWVVVDDPIPASASVLGTGLGRDSKLATAREKRTGWVWPAFEERTFDAFRAYYEFVPKGKWTVEYTVRLNNGGVFQLPATRVEAMYSPEMMGEAPNAAVTVGQ